MAKITSFGKADSISSGDILIPLVILKKAEDTYSGFIPGFVMKNIVENTPEECFAKLKAYLTQKLKAIKENGDTFPFFPDRKEIMKDFENVYKVEFIKIVSNKKS